MDKTFLEHLTREIPQAVENVAYFSLLAITRTVYKDCLTRRLGLLCMDLDLKDSFQHRSHVSLSGHRHLWPYATSK